mgnify:FL=1
MMRESQKTRSLSRCFLKGVQIVDPMKDDGIWLTIDSACNTSCHGTPWRKEYDLKLAKIGEGMLKATGDKERFVEE